MNNWSWEKFLTFVRSLELVARKFLLNSTFSGFRTKYESQNVLKTIQKVSFCNFTNFNFHTLKNLFCPFQIFVNLPNCFVLLHNLLSKNSFEGLKRFLKGKKGFRKFDWDFFVRTFFFKPWMNWLLNYSRKIWGGRNMMSSSMSYQS